MNVQCIIWCLILILNIILTEFNLTKMYETQMCIWYSPLDIGKSSCRLSYSTLIHRWQQASKLRGKWSVHRFSWSQDKMAYSTLYFGLYMNNNYVNFNFTEALRREHNLLNSLKWVFSCLNYSLSPESFTKPHCLLPAYSM